MKRNKKKIIKGYVTITRVFDYNTKGEAVLYTEDGKFFDTAVVITPPVFDSQNDIGDVWYSDEIWEDDEIRKASEGEIYFYKKMTQKEYEFHKRWVEKQVEEEQTDGLPFDNDAVKKFMQMADDRCKQHPDCNWQCKDCLFRD